MLKILQRAGIPSYVTTILSTIPINPQVEIPIAKTIPKQIGLIFGMSINVNGVTPANQSLITAAESRALYMVLKDGPTEFFQQLRLSQMVDEVAATGLRDHRYLPVNIPGDFDLSTSFYANPGSIVSTAEVTKVIMLNLWFVSTESLKWLAAKDYIDKGVLSFIDRK